ncbi:MAG: hypothetical protein P8K08_18985, partial [Fuerstiella sp.]|nr:hypothetical protein [Fuerstiella sp.]
AFVDELSLPESGFVSDDSGEVYGRPITDEESEQHPIAKIASYFGHDLSMFPNGLKTRQELEDAFESSTYHNAFDDDEY